MITINKILFEICEGRNDQLGQHVFETIDQIDNWLIKKNREVREENAQRGFPGTYLKSDFKIFFSDGETYSGNYDLGCKSEFNLTKHVLQHVSFYAGKWQPAHLTNEQYKECLDRTEKHNPGSMLGHQNFLKEYSEAFLVKVEYQDKDIQIIRVDKLQLN